MTEWPLAIEVDVENLGDGGVVLRAPDPIDASAATQAITASLDHLRPFMEWASKPPAVDQQALRLAVGREAFDAGGDANYLIFGGDEVIGGIGLHRRQGPGVLEIGYWLRPDREGGGVISAAVRALLRVAFEVDGAERVVIRCDQANTRSAAVAERCGFTLVDVVDDVPKAPANTGRMMVWEQRRGP